MKSGTILLSKSEAHPIGEVLGLIVIWMENLKTIGEVYFVKENDQKNIIMKKVSISKNNWKHCNIEQYLVNEIKNYHKKIMLNRKF